MSQSMDQGTKVETTLGIHDRFRVPSPVTEVDKVFPSRGATLIPSEHEMPKEFAMGSGRHPAAMFLRTLRWTPGIQEVPVDQLPPFKAEIEREAALDHLHVVNGCRSISQQHKVAGIAFLLSKWCDGLQVAAA
jgi:hypothetical protein